VPGVADLGDAALGFHQQVRPFDAPSRRGMERRFALVADFDERGESVRGYESVGGPETDAYALGGALRGHRHRPFSGAVLATVDVA